MYIPVTKAPTIIAGAIVAGISMHVAERITHQSRRTAARNSSNSSLLSPARPAPPPTVRKRKPPTGRTSYGRPFALQFLARRIPK
jgi:hypothetical protein